jgi:hypothetical protein
MNACIKALSNAEAAKEAYEDIASDLSFEEFIKIENLTDSIISGETIYYWRGALKQTLTVEDATAAYIEKVIDTNSKFGSFIVKQTRTLFQGKQTRQEQEAAHKHMTDEIRLLAFELIAKNYDDIIEEEKRTEHPEAA